MLGRVNRLGILDNCLLVAILSVDTDLLRAHPAPERESKDQQFSLFPHVLLWTKFAT